jgi:hypothetical protein
MRQQERKVHNGRACCAVVGGLCWAGCVRFVALIGSVLACMAGFAVAAQVADACLNEAARTGPSANLPDCRAYEQVTPANKSSAVQDMDSSSSEAVAALDGERLALKTLVTFGPTPQLGGSFSIFTRNPSRFRWEIESVKPPDSGSTVYQPQILSPELTQVGVVSTAQYPFSPDETFQIGVPGGPFGTIAETSREERDFGDGLHGASSDFSHVVFASTDHELLPGESTGTDELAHDLYEWVNGQQRLVNVTGEGSQAKVIGKCGATLGGGLLFSHIVGGTGLAHNAVSADGSKIFFTAPDPEAEGDGCPNGPLPGPNALRLYMRVTRSMEGSEKSSTVEVSAPESKEMHLSPSEEEMPVYYQAATADGSKVFFLTRRALTKGAVGGEAHLYEYDTTAAEGTQLKLIFQSSSGSESELELNARSVFPSQDGSVVYFYRSGYSTLYRYEEGAGPPQQIASLSLPYGNELPYSTPDGEFFMFASEGVKVGEEQPALRGMGHNELYRYDHRDGSVMCVSCGPGNVPAGNAYTGEAHEVPGEPNGYLPKPTVWDENPERILMSADGSEVFFDSTEALTPQVVDGGVSNVYEWEADGAGECTQSLGCTYLISQGNNQSNSELVGASVDGSNVFFMTHAQLVPQDTDTSNDIYDARVGGGFPSVAESPACLGDTCVGQPVALNDPTPALSSFVGSGNPTPVEVPKGCGKDKVRNKKGVCVRKRKAKKLGAKKVTRRAIERKRGSSR